MNDDLSKLRSRSAAAGGGDLRPLLEDLKAIGWTSDYIPPGKKTLAVTVERLIGELAALSEIADGNRSVPTDAGRRYREIHAPTPGFDAAGAQQALDEAKRRLWREYEKLAGKARRPAQSEKKKCVSCGRRVRLLDEYCGPCGSDILAKHRRKN